ncbi:TraB family protein [Tritonibacter multivorans]|uniref:TraB family protein n=1 Tax=Tritonibacter multivorans TaxID=928856 RepID=A0A0N7LZP7_9RHOB|nr:TraB/GumN family protein [Tritonibacter multivorans]MDA7422864.1 TraB/GumN family protein [Tritonibacter multivorans]CUH78257.1 TraB family protein [Tritonibacter multivorans]SFD62395.1 hypothetical protein SAMN04488049_11839 [Tritonibacter multivorans]
MRRTAKFLSFALLLGALQMALPTAAEARCQGRDLRADLSPELRQRLTSDAARVPYSEGNHWIARKGDRTLHVVGTQHSGDPRMGRVMRQLRPVIRDMDLVLLEVTAAQIATHPEFDDDPSQAQYFLLPEGQRLDQLMSKSDWQFLLPQLLRTGFAPEAALQLQPWVIGDMIGPDGCLPRGIGRRRGLDDRIERQAHRAKVPVAGLEDTNAGLAALSAMPLRDQARMLLLDLRSQTDHNSLAHTQSAAYFQERLTEGRILMTWALYGDLDVSRKEVRRLLRAMDREILDGRNRAWMKQLARHKDRKILMAVGAAHLPGEVGMLNLLDRAGWSLSRASF